MITYRCESCEGGPCLLIIEIGASKPSHCPWGPEGFSNWVELIEKKVDRR